MSESVFSAEYEGDFKRLFVIQFLAAYVANNFQEACVTGRHQSLREPPVEDANHLAKAAWEHYVHLVGLAEVST